MKRPAVPKGATIVKTPRKNGYPRPALSWPNDVMPSRFFNPLVYRFAAPLWANHVRLAEGTQFMDSIDKHQISATDFDPKLSIGWKQLVAEQACTLSRTSDVERFTRRLYSAEKEARVIEVGIADTILTAIGCHFEIDSDVPVLPGNMNNCTEWADVWLDRPLHKHEARDVMRWVTRFVYSDSLVLPDDTPELIVASRAAMA